MTPKTPSFTCQDSTLNCSTNSHSLIRVNRFAGKLTKYGFHSFLDLLRETSMPFYRCPLFQNASPLTLGTLVIPPTSNTSPMSPLDTLASLMAFSHGSMVLLIRSAVRVSNFDLDRVRLRCLGPLESMVRKGRLMSVCIGDDGH